MACCATSFLGRTQKQQVLGEANLVKEKVESRPDEEEQKVEQMKKICSEKVRFMNSPKISIKWVSLEFFSITCFMGLFKQWKFIYSRRHIKVPYIKKKIRVMFTKLDM